jgi:hypothetical protein
MKHSALTILRGFALVMVVALGVLTLCTALTGCAAMADAMHGNPAPRAVSLQPSCLFFCFAATTATYTRGDEIPPGAPASDSSTSNTGQQSRGPALNGR